MLINEGAAGSAGSFLQVQRDYAASDDDFLAQVKEERTGKGQASK